MGQKFLIAKTQINIHLDGLFMLKNISKCFTCVNVSSNLRNTEILICLLFILDKRLELISQYKTYRLTGKILELHRDNFDFP